MENRIALILGLSSIVSVVLYIVGYTYLESFYDFFDVSLSELNFGFEEILVHSAPVVLESITDTWITFPLLFSTLILIDLPLIRIFRPLSFLGVAGVLVSIALLIHSAEDIGRMRASDERNNYPFAMIPPSNTLLQNLLESDGFPSLHFLARADGYSILIVNFFDSGSFWIVRMPDGEADNWIFSYHE